MERAAGSCAAWLEEEKGAGRSYHIFCGKGNNGGDGLAIARILVKAKNKVTVHILEFGHKGTVDFQQNLASLHQYPQAEIRFIQSEEQFPLLIQNDIIVDALLGSGLNRALEGVTANLVEHMNASDCEIISIDIPSGLFTDCSSRGNIIARASHTLSFQTCKLAFLVAENAAFIGEVHILDIGLHRDYYENTAANYELVDSSIIHSIYRPRNRFAHKGNYGHALLIAGSYGKIGAAVLAAHACLRSGVGLLSCHIPKCGYEIMQTSLPEAMVMTDFNSSFNTNVEDDVSKYSALAIGPGLGTASETKALLRNLLTSFQKPLVLDADGLNNIAAQKELLTSIAPGSILTPHPKEFERLFGETANEFDRVELAINKARDLNIVIVLKGHHTLIATPEGKGYFNSTGNAGMATAGSGDVLTGILTGLLAQGYSPVHAAILGVYIHGLAGDIAAEHISMESLVAGDIVQHLGEAFRKMSNSQISTFP